LGLAIDLYPGSAVPFPDAEARGEERSWVEPGTHVGEGTVDVPGVRDEDGTWEAGARPLGYTEFPAAVLESVVFGATDVPDEGCCELEGLEEGGPRLVVGALLADLGARDEEGREDGAIVMFPMSASRSRLGASAGGARVDDSSGECAEFPLEGLLDGIFDPERVDCAGIIEPPLRRARASAPSGLS
jgi:hypothetical protein